MAAQQPKSKPLPLVTVHFLGTCSGGGPIVSRNCSSLAIDFGNDIWLFDAADGTLPRLQQSSLKLANISRIFITHMHADHVLGLVSILTTIMSGVGTTEQSLKQLSDQGTNKKANLNIYGPRGLRRLIRVTLEITSVTLGGVYAVHEIFPEGAGSAGCSTEQLHINEAVGQDLIADENGVWEDVLLQGQGKSGKGWGVSAGPIEHRVPSLGYILQEPTPLLPLDTSTLIPLLHSNAAALATLDPPIVHPLSLLSHTTSLPRPCPFRLPSGDTLFPPEPSGVPPRKMVVFGDCSGGTNNEIFRSMCEDPSLLIHECTNAAIPELIQRGEKGRKVRMNGMDAGLVRRSEEKSGKPTDKESSNNVEVDYADRLDRENQKLIEVRRKAQSRGHSTPAEVGLFAKEIRARRVVVNHFSAMFPCPRYATSEPFPSILSPMSPYPYPSPYPPSRITDASPGPLPLSGLELHMRLIMQSIGDQISAMWKSKTSKTGVELKPEGQMVAMARDFMVLRIPSHEPADWENEESASVLAEICRVQEEWRAYGGMWLSGGDTRRWVGVTPSPGEAE